MDIVFIKGLKVAAIIGIYEHERIAKQEVLIDIEMATDIGPAARSTDIAQTVNYKDVAEKAESLVVEGEYLLVETLAEDLAKLILSAFSTPWVKLTIAKPQAIDNVDRVGVVIERGVRQ